MACSSPRNEGRAMGHPDQACGLAWLWVALISVMLWAAIVALLRLLIG